MAAANFKLLVALTVVTWLSTLSYVVYLSGSRLERRECKIQNLFWSPKPKKVVHIERIRNNFPKAKNVESPRKNFPKAKNVESPRKNLLIGVMTEEKYLRTRAIAINKTWARELGPGSRLYFFVGEDCNTDHPSLRDLPIVKLRGVKDGVYPPQEKSFALWQYLSQHHGKEFKWFFRADDDVYIRVSKLETALQGVNWMEELEMGSPAYGLQKDRKRLKLLPGETYCMGGPGVLLSAPALNGVSAYLGKCLEAVRAYNEGKDEEHRWYNEDVELGRCVSRTLGIGCSPLTQNKFDLYQDYTSKHVDLDNFWKKKFHNFITLHPVNEPAIMFGIYHYHLTLKLHSLESELSNHLNLSIAVV